MNSVDNNVFLNINLKSINKNYRIIQQKIGKKCIIAATVKANAYGLGVDKIVPSLIKAGCMFFLLQQQMRLVTWLLNEGLFP